jgi:hypothetical protein
VKSGNAMTTSFQERVGVVCLLAIPPTPLCHWIRTRKDTGEWAERAGGGRRFSISVTVRSLQTRPKTVAGPQHRLGLQMLGSPVFELSDPCAEFLDWVWLSDGD